MRIRIDHSTRYAYARPARFIIQTLRLTPEPRRRAAFAARARPGRAQGEKPDMIGQTHDRTRALRMSLSKSGASRGIRMSPLVVSIAR